MHRISTDRTQYEHPPASGYQGKRRAHHALICAIAVTALLNGCSLRHMAAEKIGDALAQGGNSFAMDDDPELIRDATPFSLKLMESLLAETPQHRGLLLATARSFTQYAYAFLQQDADEIEYRDLAAATRLRERARALYRRARDYGLRGLETRQRDFQHRLNSNPSDALAGMEQDDVALLYWTGAAWGALISLSKDRPEALADLPVVEAIMDRALALDETFDRGAIHTFMIGYEMVRQGRPGDPAQRARHHFSRAIALSAGHDASPLLALAEAVSVPGQDRNEFENLLRQALLIDVNANAQNRLANQIMQRRARWLLSHADHLFNR